MKYDLKKFLHDPILICMSIFLAILSIIYIRNIFYYETYWAYDGGAHVNYIFTIIDEGRLPTPEENYLAWHEPLFYVISALQANTFLTLGFSREAVIYMIQFSSAFIGLWFVAGAEGLSYIVTKKKDVSLFVMIFVGLLYVVSSTSRYITNELFFHALTLWWLILFFYWRMHTHSFWNWKRWLVLVLGLSILVWVKLTAWVVVLAIIVWLIIYSLTHRYWRGLLIAGFIFIVVGVLYSPWLIHKYKVYGTAFTINSYEIEKDTHMTRKFFVRWNSDVLDYPIWDSSKNSFWSMFLASTFVDYDNVFENYESSQYEQGKFFKTSNERAVSTKSVAKQTILLWFSLPYILFFVIGGFVWLVQMARSRFKNNDLLLGILAAGFFASLVYNVWQYPFLDRGTMKTIFILVFFPLVALLSVGSLQCIVEKWKYKTVMYALFWGYVVVWSVLSVNVIWLPV
ncbi:MAG: hypothetical protein A2479_00410 [Candidatus Magasanikbacteria bacterium RIFOXYC2_FULL_39_8]|nr:MAG: hypothetical protein A2479_00410 [Candidatus Magasanikbacteria bacterium RIFOXYC2_FULL_39_8]